MLLLISCQSLEIESEKNIPEFPQPYNDKGVLVVEYISDIDKVTMPLWYWKKIVRFAIDVKGVSE